ncbi:MAG: hypothetical protein WCW31_00970 [Patescibacteria group bacterium]|jgi:hypothetical protein
MARKAKKNKIAPQEDAEKLLTPDIITARIVEFRIRQIREGGDEFARDRIQSLRDDIKAKASSLTAEEASAYDSHLAWLDYCYLGESCALFLSKALVIQDQVERKLVLEQASKEFLAFQRLISDQAALVEKDPPLHAIFLDCGAKIQELMPTQEQQPIELSSPAATASLE